MRQHDKFTLETPVVKPFWVKILVIIRNKIRLETNCKQSL